MKNNQFRAHLTKYIYGYVELDPDIRMRCKCLSVDINSNTRKIYLYKYNDYTCIGSISLYFTNECVNIAYSKTSDTVCRLRNTQEEQQFDYCKLRDAILFINKAIYYFRKGEKICQK